MADGIDIRAALDRAPEELLEYLAGKDYRITANWAEMWQEDHVRSFTVAHVAKMDLLETIRTSLDDAWRTGKPIDQWRAELIPELQKAGWWGVVQDRDLTGTDDAIFVGPRRLKNIYVTNFRMAGAAANWKYVQAGKKYLPYLMYRTMKDDRVRDQHARLEGIILPVDHPFWLTWWPPNGWNCRCDYTALSERMMERRGLKVTPDDKLPELPVRPFWRPGADRPELVPQGMAPGFGYNPGVSYLRAFEPPPLDRPLAIPSRGARPADAPPPPLPEPQRLPADTLLPRDIGDEQAIGRFVDGFRAQSAQVGDALVYRDQLGNPIVISERFFQYPNGSSKLSSERRQTILLLGEAIRRPDEIWWVWERVAVNRARTKFRWRLTRRYVARFQIEGETRQAVVVMQVGKDGWQGVSAFPTTASYLDKEQVRGGVLGWRRVPE